MLFWTLITVALAQTPGEFRWLVAETTFLRFADSEEVSATVKASTKVEVVAVGETLVRVRAGRDFGWVSTDALTDTKPEAN